MKILIIGPSWVGDSVMAQTLYKRLKDEESSCTIDVISPEWSLPLMQRMPEVSKVIVSPYSHGDVQILSRYRFGKKLKESKYDRAIILTNSLKSSLIPFFADIPIRTGWLGELRYGLLNDIRRINKASISLMVENFASLSMQKDSFSIENLSFPSLEIDSENQRKYLEKLNINSDLPCLGICPGAEFGPSKKWPAHYFSQVAKEYISRGWNVICFGSNNDKETGRKLESLNGLLDENKFYNLIGMTSLIDVVDLLAYCKKVVTNDSGLMHVAAAVKTPLVALYGPSSPEYTPPLIHNKKVIRKFSGYQKIRKGAGVDGYHDSLLSIKPSEVINALEAI
ncbi:MAG: lipopolysaccharide heptosyltransferase II [Pseudomonadota bacterium]|nr:lipopolysaccharide heptosyltransferase II [Pseudomonadota bacterium]